MTDNLNIPKLIDAIEITKIGKNSHIGVGLYEKRNNKFYDVVLKLNDKEIFIGRFNKEFNKLRVKYADGKILVYYDEFSKQSNKMEIIKVLSLYDILDNTFYSCTEIEALELFDKDINSSNLKDKDNYIRHSDCEKRKRLK